MQRPLLSARQRQDPPQRHRKRSVGTAWFLAAVYARKQARKSRRSAGPNFSRPTPGAQRCPEFARTSLEKVHKGDFQGRIDGHRRTRSGADRCRCHRFQPSKGPGWSRAQLDWTAGQLQATPELFDSFRQSRVSSQDRQIARARDQSINLGRHRRRHRGVQEGRRSGIAVVKEGTELLHEDSTGELLSFEKCRRETWLVRCGDWMAWLGRLGSGTTLAGTQGMRSSRYGGGVVTRRGLQCRACSQEQKWLPERAVDLSLCDCSSDGWPRMVMGSGGRAVGVQQSGDACRSKGGERSGNKDHR